MKNQELLKAILEIAELIYNEYWFHGAVVSSFYLDRDVEYDDVPKMYYIPYVAMYEGKYYELRAYHDTKMVDEVYALYEKMESRTPDLPLEQLEILVRMMYDPSGPYNEPLGFDDCIESLEISRETMVELFFQLHTRILHYSVR